MKILSHLIVLSLFSTLMLTMAQPTTPIITLLPVSVENCCFDIDIINLTGIHWNSFKINTNQNNTQQTYIFSAVPSSGSYSIDPSAIQPQTSQVIWRTSSYYLSNIEIVGSIWFTQHSVQNNFSNKVMYINNREQT